MCRILLEGRALQDIYIILKQCVIFNLFSNQFLLQLIGNSPISAKRIIVYPAALARTQYVSGDTVILSIGGCTHWFVYVLFCSIQSEKNRFNSTNHVGHVLNDYFNRTNPQWRRRVFSPGAQLKRANTLSTNPSFGGEGRVCTIAK